MVFRDLDKQALKQNAYTVLSKITLLNDNSIFTEDDFIVDWSYEDYRYVPDNGFIGQFVERLLDGNLQNIPDDKIFENQEVNLKIGIVNGIDNITTWYDYGNFLITDVKKTDTTGKYSFQSADYTKKFNKVFDGDYTDTVYTKSFNQKIEDEETVTALWLAQYVCKQAGVVLYTTNFTNADFVISSNQYDSEDTLRKVMQDIGKLAYSWVRVAEDNKVHIDFTPKTTSSVDQYDQLTTDEYYVSKKSDLTFGPVNKVLIGMSSVEGENMYETSQDYTPETECAIKIYDNNLTNTEELRELALNGCERLFGIEYTPMEIETIGHPWLEGDELIKLTNVDDEVLYTYPFNRKLTYAGYIKGTIGAEATTTQDSEYEYKSDIISNVKKTTIIVDKQNQTITGLVEDVDENTSNITTLQESVGGISATVEALDNSVQDVTDQVNSVLQAEKTIKGNPVNIEDGGEYLIKNISFYGNLEQETEEEEAGTIVQINGSATLTDVDTTKESRVISLKGQTSQETTTGKNLLNTNLMVKFTPAQQTWYSLDGITGFYNAEAIARSNLYYEVTSGTTYTISIHSVTNKNTTVTNPIQLVNDTGSAVVVSIPQNSTSATFTASENGKVYPRISVGSTNVETQCIVQLEVGSSATSFEPYTGGIPSPNPSFPEHVHVVSGNNIINICGKNLFDIGNSISGYFATNNNGFSINTSVDISTYVSATFDNNTITITNYNTSGYRWLSKLIKLNKNTTYTISSGELSQGVIVCGCNSLENGSTGTQLVRIDNQNLRPPKTFNSGSYKYYYIAIYPKSAGSTYPDIMVEPNSTASNYEPYIGNTYPIYLGVENLYNGTNYAGYVTSSGSFNTTDTYTRRTDFIPIEASKNYIVSTNTQMAQIQVSFYSSNNISNFIQRDRYYNISNQTFTTPNNASYVIIDIKKDNNTMLDDTSMTTYQFQLETGTKVNHISTTPIELCKIGTYQDYIYKDNGSWYLHKEIGKVVLNGSETITSNPNGTNSFYIPLSNSLAKNDELLVMSSSFKGIKYNDRATGGNNTIYAENIVGKATIRNTTFTTLELFITWLSTNKPIVYYVLATPTTTEITDTTLLEQLDALESQ